MASTYEIVGPFQRNYVTVHGCQVPFLDAIPMNGGKIALSIDRNSHVVDIPVDLAEALIPWLADLIAVALGYSAHPHAADIADPGVMADVLADIEGRARLGKPNRSHPFRAMHRITSVTTEPVSPDDDDPLSRLDPDG